ncbi:MAG: ClbS/DfsB family four-helix bundle protein [Chloroflexota bacterium]|nr:ClbS/DfsB family four-helix bundle protein [Chloroflexota bacterium]
MPEATTGKTGWLERIEREREAWEAIVSQVSDTDMDRPGAAGEWNFKDVVAHLNGWRERTVDRLEAAGRGEAPTHDLSDETDEEVEATNRTIYDRNRDRPAADILAESREQFRRMREAVETLSEDTLVTPGRFDWLDGEPLSAVLDGSFGHLHEEHEPAIRAWLTAKPR